MQLEDHIGDILRKMQSIFNIDKRAMIATSGIEESEWKTWIKSGTLSDETYTRVKWVELGNLIGVQGQRLKAIADGWLPDPVNYEDWPGLVWIQNSDKEGFPHENEANFVNSYILWSDDNHEAVLFDRGWQATKTLDYLQKKHLKLTQVFLTHAHRDHVNAKPVFKRLFPEASFFDYYSFNNLSSTPPQNFGPFRIQPCLAPGHSPDHVVYRVSGFRGNSNFALIVGDCLFSGSLGYPFYDRERLLETLRKQILCLPPNTLLCPGHGPLSTLREEFNHNPFTSNRLLKC